MNHDRLSLGLLATVVLLVLACGDPDRKTAGACEGSDDCGGGVCFDSACYTACTAQDDCADGQYCVREEADGGTVSICETAADYQGCVSDEDCAKLVAGDCQRPACDLATGTCELQPAPEAPTCDAGPLAYSTRVLMAVEAPGENCPGGGVAVHTYFDADGDGEVGDREIVETSYVCHGLDGAPGLDGANGSDGADGTNGADGVSGADGAAGSNGLSTLITTAELAAEPGSGCPAGGLLVQAGLDLDGDGLLDASEVSSTAQLCNGLDGADGANGSDGADGTDGTDGVDGVGCTIVDNGDGIKTVTCGGTSVTLTDGADGVDGVDGAAGAPCSVVKEGSVTTITCGEQVVTVLDGADGAPGQDGADGLPCSVSDNGDGTVTITCADGSTATFGGAGPSGTVLHGSFRIDNAADVAFLQGYEVITGNLTIDATGLTGVELPALREVGGALDLVGSTMLSVELPLLHTIGTRLWLQSPSLTGLSLPALTTVGQLLVDGSVALATLDLPLLSQCSWVSLYQSALTALHLEALVKLESLQVMDASLVELHLGGLVEIGLLDIWDPYRLSYLDLGALETAESVRVNGGTGLTVLEFPVLSSLGWLEVSNWGQGPVPLQRIALPNLQAAGSVSIRDLSSLDELDLSGLAEITAGSLALGGLPMLSRIELPRLTSVLPDWLQISGNGGLTEVAMPLLTSAGGFEISYNPLLPECLVLAILEHVTTSDVFIGGLRTDCTCAGEPLVATCACRPACDLVTCGQEDGCGGTCGCIDGYACDGGTCVCQPQCDGIYCGNWADDNCGGECGCNPGFACVYGYCTCEPACDGKTCDEDNGCGVPCGCGEGQMCEDGACVCQPQCDGLSCDHDDGCGGACGCPQGQECRYGWCGCFPDCNDKACDQDNGCGQPCGCDAGLSCVGGACTCVPDCAGRECGDDGCGGSCGTCADGAFCGTAGLCLAVDTDWVDLPGGTYLMGSPDGIGEEDERPQHAVTLSPFRMARSETMQGQYQACLADGICSEPGCDWEPATRGDHPVQCVDWFQAAAYCEWAGGRLCTEAEWEYAARSGGQFLVYPWGNEYPTCDTANGDYQCHGDTVPGCSKPAGNSAHGLCDLAGNVWEWVADWYDVYPVEVQNDPPGPDSGVYRVVRGGGWDFGEYVRAARRAYLGPDADGWQLGLRCCRSTE